MPAATSAAPAPSTGAPAPEPVAGTADIPQYWKRNTLVLDMRAVRGTGSVELKPRDGTTWPVRLALRVQPGAVGQFEVRADQRVIIPVVGGGSQPLDLELPPGVYGPSSSQLSLAWGPAGSP